MITVTREMIEEITRQIDIALKYAQGKRPQDLAAMTDPSYLWSVLHYMMYNTNNSLTRIQKKINDDLYRDKCLAYNHSVTDLGEF